MGFGSRVWGLGCKVYGSGFWVQGSGFRVQGSGFGVLGQGSGFTAKGVGLCARSAGVASGRGEKGVQGRGCRVPGFGVGGRALGLKVHGTAIVRECRFEGSKVVWALGLAPRR